MAKVKLCGMRNDLPSIDETRMADLENLGIAADEAVDIVAYERGLRHNEPLCDAAYEAIALLARMLGVSQDAQVIGLLISLSRRKFPKETHRRFLPQGWVTARRAADIRDRLPEYGRICFYEVSILPSDSNTALFMFEKDGAAQLSGIRVNLAEDRVLDDIDGADNAAIKADALRLVEVALEALLASPSTL